MLIKQNKIVHGLEYYKRIGDLNADGLRQPTSIYSADSYLTNQGAH